jgi:hypothetical protein
MATDGSGNIFVVWEQDGCLQRDQIFFARSTDGGDTFSPPRNISNATGLAFRHAIATDERGSLLVVWVNQPDVSRRQIFFSRSDNEGESFSMARNISNTPGWADFPRIGTDRYGNIFVVWENFTLGHSQIFFNQSTPNEN